MRLTETSHMTETETTNPSREATGNVTATEEEEETGTGSETVKTTEEATAKEAPDRRNLLIDANPMLI